MSPNPGIRCLLISMMLAVAGCESTPKTPEPIGAASLTLDQEAKRTTAQAKLGYELTLSLPAIPGEYDWVIMSADTRFVKQLSEISPSLETSRTNIRFLLLRKGRTVIRFLALPADRGSAADPVTSHEVVLTIE